MEAEASHLCRGDEQVGVPPCALDHRVHRPHRSLAPLLPTPPLDGVPLSPNSLCSGFCDAGYEHLRRVRNRAISGSLGANLAPQLTAQKLDTPVDDTSRSLDGCDRRGEPVHLEQKRVLLAARDIPLSGRLAEFRREPVPLPTNRVPLTWWGWHMDACLAMFPVRSQNESSHF